MTIAKQNKW